MRIAQGERWKQWGQLLDRLHEYFFYAGFLGEARNSSCEGLLTGKIWGAEKSPLKKAYHTLSVFGLVAEFTQEISNMGRIASWKL